MTENEFNDLHFRFGGVDISTYIKANKYGKVLFGNTYHMIYAHSGTNQLLINVPVKYNTGTVMKTLYLRNLVYCYYNRLLNIPDNHRLIVLNGNQFDIRIENLRLIKNSVSNEMFNTWQFRYNYVKDINVYIDAKPGDIIPFLDRTYTVSMSNDIHNRPSIKVTVEDERGISRTKLLYLHRLIWEFYNNRILSSKEVIHHKDGNKHNNSIDNLIVLSDSEHKSLHNVEKYRKVINITTNEIYDSLGEAARKNNIVNRAIYNCCKGFSKSAKGYVWKYYDVYLKEIGKTEEEIEELLKQTYRKQDDKSNIYSEPEPIVPILTDNMDKSLNNYLIQTNDNSYLNIIQSLDYDNIIEIVDHISKSLPLCYDILKNYLGSNVYSFSEYDINNKNQYEGFENYTEFKYSNGEIDDMMYEHYKL